MATNDQELISEVRSLTDYDETILSDSDMQDLVGLAKREIEIEVGERVDDFYSNRIREGALFWLVCFFTKLKTGEYEGMDLTISEIEINKVPEGSDTRIWIRNFNKRFRQLRSENRSYVANVSRSGREYNDQRDAGNDST